MIGHLNLPWSAPLVWALALAALAAAAWAVYGLVRDWTGPQKASGAYQVINGLPFISATAIILIGGPIWIWFVWQHLPSYGHWVGNEFVYYDPKLVFSTQMTPEDDGRVYPIKIEDADPKAFAKFKIEYDGGLGKAQFVIHEQNQIDPRSISRETTYGIRLSDDRTTKLVAHIPRNSDTTLVRAYLLSWVSPNDRP